MKYVFLISILFFSFSCNRNIVKKDQLENNPSYEFWVNDFKETVFVQCLKRGYNDSDIYNEFINEETNIQDFPLGIVTYRFIDSLAENIRYKIYVDSIGFYNKWIKNNNDFLHDGLTGKRTIHHCLEYYRSEELDSIAKAHIKPKKYLYDN
ncbi:MAG TPA: hypothetical protein ENJ95_14945 [Bacteroidetes bacterium]|nr:hypothetical protein [Bacteroidota bacterium]